MLLTGSHGFVGSAFTALAERDYELIRVARRGGHAGDVVWDLAEPAQELLPAARVVVHLASITARSADDRTSPDEYRRQNVEGTRNLCAAFAEPPAYFLYVSTADVYGGGDGGPITEATPTAPRTVYAASKLEAEEVATSFCAARGIPIGIARLGPVYGPGELGYTKAIPVFLSKAIAGEPIVVTGAGRAKRHFVFVDDVARALLLMAAHQTRGPVNVAGSKPTSVSELAELVVELTGSDAGVRYIESDRPELDVRFDTTRLTGLGLTEQVDLREGLRRQIAWLRGR